MIRWMFLVSLALSVSACNSTALDRQDERVAEKAPDQPGQPGQPGQPPAFNLTNSQTCGTQAPAALPEDETARDEIALADLSEKLATTGIDGWIHAAAEPFGEYVLTYRKPGDFFSHLEMAIIPASEDAKAQFAGLVRGDKVHVVGQLVNKISPLGHVLVSSLTMVKKYEPVTPHVPYQYSVDLAGIKAELQKDTALYAVVHAQTATGGVLVLDYKDMVLPVYVPEKYREQAKALFRGDIVGIAYKIRETPHEPLHVEIDESTDNSLIVYDHMVWCHDKKDQSLTGELVLFEKSPQITMNVWALRHTDANGMQRNWTLVNFEDQEQWLAMNDKLAAAWDANKATLARGRNQLLNPKLKITAHGTMNVVSQSQANPQLMVAGPDAVSIEVLP